MRTLRILVASMFVCSLFLGIACSDDDSSGNREICNNLVDDDGDGLTDCADSDCLNAANCTANTCDNDGICEAANGETSTTCPNDCPVTACDNDGICEAAQGETTANCPNDCQTTQTEICDNNTDDDGDGAIDCADTDCANDAACQTTDIELSCVGLFQCYNCCGSDTTCYDACDALASSSAGTQMTAINSCAQSSCATECGSGGTSESCNTCVDTNCSSQMDACGWDSTGSTGCLDLNTCLNACDDYLQTGTATTCPDLDSANAGLGCIQECYNDASSTGADALGALVDCLFDDAVCGTQCPGTDCTTCQQTAMASGGDCYTEATACQ